MVNFNKQLILASNSPRRKQILQDAGFEVQVVANQVNEDYPDDMPLSGVPKYLAEKKFLILLKVCGEHSIQIYLVHMLAGVAIRVILLTLFFIENPLLHMVLGVMGGLLVPVVLYKISFKFNFPFLFELRKPSSSLK